MRINKVRNKQNNHSVNTDKRQEKKINMESRLFTTDLTIVWYEGEKTKSLGKCNIISTIIVSSYVIKTAVLFSPFFVVQ